MCRFRFRIQIERQVQSFLLKQNVYKLYFYLKQIKNIFYESSRKEKSLYSPHQNYQESVYNLCWINYIRNLEPNCQYSCSSCSSLLWGLSPNLCLPLKIFTGLSKHLPVSLRYKKTLWGVGGWGGGGVGVNSGSGLWWNVW